VIQNRTKDTRNFSELTPREAEVLELRKQKKTYKEIAEILGISPKTVDTIATKAREKVWSHGA
jgi:RNA polymerase sigma factor (sigma-70 family)